MSIELNDKKFQQLKTYLETNQNVDESDHVFGRFIKVIKFAAAKGILDDCYITPLTDRGLDITRRKQFDTMILRCHRNDIDKWLEIGKDYTLEYANIGGFSSELKLEESEKTANSVQFMNGDTELCIWDIPLDMRHDIYLQ